MKGNAGTPGWEHDLGPDDMGEIFNEMDGERMEAELSSRLGSMLASTAFLFACFSTHQAQEWHKTQCAF